jgi:hypothetical protein
MQRVVVVAVLGLLAAPAGARADVALEELGRLTPVAGYAGWHAWSAYDETTARYALRLLDPNLDLYAPYPPAPQPWDVQLGPDASGVPTLIYRSCDASGCDLRRRNLATGAEQRLRSVSSPSFDEATPAIWRSTVVFTRRIRGCDVPYVKDLRSRAPSRRLLRTTCLQTRAGHASIRGTRIVISSQAGVGAGRKTSELRRYSARARGSRVILRQNFGEESNLFGQVVQDERFATTVRHGVHPVDGFVRVAWGSGRVEEVPAHKELGGGFARRDQDRWIVVEAQEEDEVDCQGFAAVPCRLVGTLVSPFSGVVRELTPELSVAYEGTPRRGQPLVFSGRLVRRSASRGEIVRTQPLAGITVDLRHRTGDDPERFEPTGLKAVTDADGRWRIVLPAAGEDPWYTAVAATGAVTTWAGRGTVGSVQP